MTEKPDEFWNDESTLNNENIPKPIPKQKVNIDGKRVRDGLAQLILTVVELLRELMEKQAIRRIENGALDDTQVENLGNTFMALKNEIDKLKGQFNLNDDDLNISLGSFSLRDDSVSGQTSAVELLDRLLGKGVVVKGDVIISVADVDLLSLNLGLLLASIDKAQELYAVSSTAVLEKEVQRLKDENRRLNHAANKI